jgi:hypothetical protein
LPDNFETDRIFEGESRCASGRKTSVLGSVL